MLENRSFDHMLGFLKRTIPTVEGLTGDESNPTDPGMPGSPRIAVNDRAAYKGDLETDPGHDLPDVGVQLYGRKNPDFHKQGNNGGFVLNYTSRNDGDVGKGARIMRCFDPRRLAALASLAEEFCVCDGWHASVPGPTWPNRFFVHAATSGGSFENGAFLPEDTQTLFHQLLSSGHEAAIYYHDISQALAIRSLWRNPYRSRILPFRRFFSAAKTGQLPRYSFLEPRYFNLLWKRANDQHPDHDVRKGETLVSDVYNALRSSPAWEDTILVVTYDEHGGTYDHCFPPRAVNPDGKNSSSPPFDFTRLGPRVPAVLISPRIPAKTVEKTVFDHASISATVRRLLGLTQPLSERDAWANTFDHVLDSPLRQDTPESIRPSGVRRARSEHERDEEYGPLTLEQSKEWRRRSPAADEPLSGFQENLIDLGKELPVDEPEEFRALAFAAQPRTEEDGAVFVRRRVLDFLRR